MSARFSADAKLVVTASRDHDARIWDAGSGRLLHVLRGHFAQVNDASFSP
jgi:WD40 repeat protein